MSHISRLEIKITDVESLKKACSALGYEFLKDKKQFQWYNGKSECEHVIRVPGAKYEIGLKDEELLFDPYSPGGLTEDIPGKIKQAYGAEQVKKEARKKNYRIQEKTNKNGTIQLTLFA